MRLFLRLIRYARQYRGDILLSLVCMVGVAVLKVASIGAMQPIFDVLFGQGGLRLVKRLPGWLQGAISVPLDRLEASMRAHPLTSLTYICIGLGLVFVVKGLLEFVQEYLMTQVSERVIRDLRDDLYAHLHTLSIGFFAKTPTAELMSRLAGDVEVVGRSATSIFVRSVKEPVTIAAFGVLLFLIKWQLALASLVVLPLGGFLIVRLGERIRRRSRRLQERMAELNVIMHEGLSGIRVVQAFTMEAFETARFRRKNQETYAARMRIFRAHLVASPVLEILGSFGILLTVWIGGWLVVKRVISPGELMAFIGALASLYQPLRSLGEMNNIVQKGLGGAARIFELMDTRTDVGEAPGAVGLSPLRESIEFRDVRFEYEAGAPILASVSFRVRPGEMVAIVGSSGVGKTTLVNLLPRFYDLTGGSITIDGRDIRTLTLRSLRSQIGIVSQETFLFDETIARNIAYGLGEVPRDRLLRAAEAANVIDFVREMPDGFDTVIGERGVRLSGGQRQRIAIARAILKDPPILILDEATSSLDAESERLVQEALERLMRDRTVFVIAHRLSTVIRSDQIIVLEGGTIAEMGRHADLVARGGVYARLYEVQFQPAVAVGDVRG